MINNIINNKIDINNQELFFSTLIKGLMLRLDDDISIRGISVPHIIVHTGNDAMYLEEKGYNFAIEPETISNENYIYNIIPRCVVNPGGIDLLIDQLTNPYILGRLQYDDGENLHELVGEFRRVPLKMSVSLKYYTDTFRDMLELVQQIITKLSFVRTFDITYMGQLITCSYKIPEAFSHERMMDMDGTTQDGKARTLSLDIEVETNIPVYNPQTIMDPGKTISKPLLGTKYAGVRYEGCDYNSSNTYRKEHGIIIRNTNEIN